MADKVRIPNLKQIIVLKTSKLVHLMHESRNEAFLKKTKHPRYLEAMEALEDHYKVLRRLQKLQYEEMKKESYLDSCGFVTRHYWTSPLYTKHVQEQKALGSIPAPPEKYNVILPSGEYRIDRIYIRQGSEEYDSVTLTNVALKGRFWLKLSVFNRLGFTYA